MAVLELSGTLQHNQVLPASHDRPINCQSHLFLGNPYFCAVGLDRFLRVWRIGAGGKKPIHKMYLKSRLNCVAMSKDFDPDKKVVEEVQEEDAKENSLDDSVEILENDDDNENKEDVDDVWDNMVVIGGKKKSKESSSKRKKLK